MTTWAQTSDTAITAAIAAVGAGQVLVNNWIDTFGNTWAAQALVGTGASAGKMALTPITTPSTPWAGNTLYRPTSEDGKTQRIVATQYLSSKQTIYYELRANRATTGGAFSGYLFGVDHGSTGFTAHGFAAVNGTVGTSTQFNSVALASQPANGTLVNIDIQLTQVTATTSQITMSVTDATTGATYGTYDSGTTNSTVNNAALQNITGSVGICSYASPGNSGNAGITEIKVYNGDGTAPVPTKYTVSPASSSVVVGASTAVTFTLDAASTSAVTITPSDGGEGGKWSAATLTIAAGTTSGSLTYTAGTTAGTVTLTGTNTSGLTDGTASLTVTAAATAPSAPTFTLTAGNGQVVVNVTASSSNGGAAITGYPIYVGAMTGSEASSPATTLAAAGSYTITGLTNGNPVYVKVGATNSVGTTVAAEQTATPTSGTAYPDTGGTVPWGAYTITSDQTAVDVNGVANLTIKPTPLTTNTFYNWDAVNQLPNYVAKLAALKAGTLTSQFRVAGIGDSTTRGEYNIGGGDITANIAATSYTTMMAKSLRASGLRVSTDSFMSDGNGPGGDPRVVLGGGAKETLATLGGNTFQLLAAGDTVTFTPVDGQTYDQVTIGYLDYKSGGSLTVTVDGQATQQTDAFTGDYVWRTATFKFTESVFGKVVIGTTGGGEKAIPFMSLEHSTKPYLSVINCGNEGATAQDIVGPAETDLYSSFSSPNIILKMQFDLAIVNVGINNMRESEDATVFVPAITPTLQAMKTAGTDLIMVIPQPWNSSIYATYTTSYRAVLEAACDANNWPLADLSNEFNNSFTNPLVYSYHPQPSLYASIGSVFAERLQNPTGDVIAARKVVVTPSDNSGGGSFSPATVEFGANSNTSKTVAYTGKTAGTKSLTATNNSTLTNPSAVSLTVNSPVVAPTSLIPSLSTSSADIGTTVKVTYTLDQPATVAVVFTPWSSSNMGTWAASSATIPVGSKTTEIDYKPTTAGTVQLGALVSSGGVSPSNVALTITTPVVPGANIPVSNAAFLFSPANWYGDSGRAGSSWRRTWNVGAYFVFTFNAGASPAATIDTTGSGSSGKATVYVNGVGSTVSIGGVITVSGLVANAQNILFVIFESTPQSTRWNKGSNNFVVNGITLDTGSSPGVSVAGEKGWIQIVGDSITEGIEANGGSPQFTYCYTFSVLMALRAKGYEVCVSACGYSGYLVPGDSTKDVPPYFPISGTTRWGLIDQGISQLDSAGQLSSYGATGTAPAGIAVNYLTNEALNTDSGNWTTADSQTAMFNAMVANRKAAPNAWLFLIVPFGFHYAPKYPAQWLACFNAAMAQYAAAYPNDKKVVAIDVGADTSIMLQSNLNWLINKDDVHPLALGHAIVGPSVSGSMLTALEGKQGRSFVFRAA